MPQLANQHCHHEWSDWKLSVGFFVSVPPTIAVWFLRLPSLWQFRMAGFRFPSVTVTNVLGQFYPLWQSTFYRNPYLRVTVQRQTKVSHHKHSVKVLFSGQQMSASCFKLATPKLDFSPYSYFRNNGVTKRWMGPPAFDNCSWLNDLLDDTQIFHNSERHRGEGSCFVAQGCH